MKKILSVLLALIMVTGLIVGMQASAVKNLLPVTEETSTISDTAYVPSLQYEKLGIGSWTDVSVPDLTKTIVTLDKTTKKLGNASLKISNPKMGHSCAVININGLKSNTTYTLQSWLKMDKVLSASWGASIYVEFYNFPADVYETQPNQGKYLITASCLCSDRFSGTKDWRRVSLVFKTPAKFTNTAVSFQLWEAAGTAWYDGLALTEGKVAVDDDKLENPTPTPAPTKTPTKTPTPTAPSADKPSSWAQAEVTEAINAKLVPTALQSKYTSSITRSDFCDLVVNMIEVKSGKKIADFVKEKVGKDLSDKPFPDTTSANVNAANKLGIVNGRTNGNFDPNGLITRQEAAKMLALTAKALGADITAAAASFADGAKIADWAKEYVNFVFAKSVMAGTGNNNFSPAANYTREQSILTILRLFKALK